MQTYKAKIMYDTGYVMRHFFVSDIQAKNIEEAGREAKMKVMQDLETARAAHPEYLKTHLSIDYVALC